MSKNTIAYILYFVAFIILLLPMAADYKVRNEEQTRKSAYVSHHKCNLIAENSHLTYYDWQSNKVSIVPESKKYQCENVDGPIVVKSQ